MYLSLCVQELRRSRIISKNAEKANRELEEIAKGKTVYTREEKRYTPRAVSEENPTALGGIRTHDTAFQTGALLTCTRIALWNDWSV